MKFDVKYTGSIELDPSVVEFTISIKEEAQTEEEAINKGCDTKVKILEGLENKRLETNVKDISYTVSKRYDNVKKYYWEKADGRVIEVKMDETGGVVNEPGAKLITRNEQVFRCFACDWMLKYRMPYNNVDLLRFVEVMTALADSCSYTFKFTVTSKEQSEMEVAAMTRAIDGAKSLAAGVARNLNLGNVMLKETSVIDVMRTDVDYAAKVAMNCDMASMDRIGSAIKEQWASVFSPEAVVVSKSVSCIFEIG